MKPLPPSMLNPPGSQYPLMTATGPDEAPVCHSAVIAQDPPTEIDFAITSTLMTPREAAEQVRTVLGPFRYPAPTLWHQARQWGLDEAAWLGAGIDPDFVIPVDRLHRGALAALTPLITIIRAGLNKLIGPTGTPRDYLAAYRTLELPATAFTKEAPTTTLPAGQNPGPPPAIEVPVGDEKRTKAKPGPKPCPALRQAIDLALKLESEGLKPKQAALEAAGRFGVNSDTVTRRARRHRNSE